MDPTYSRDECIAAVKDFYEFLGNMYLDLPSAVAYPPDGGWPNITSETMACMGKDREIISLLRHLPYPKSAPFTSHPDLSMPAYRLYDWKTKVDQLLEGKTDVEEILWDVEGEAHHYGKRIPQHFVGLMDACLGKYIPPNVVLLDVRDGLVYWMNCPEHVLKTCEPQPSRLVYPLEGETDAKYVESVTLDRVSDQAEGRDSDSDSEQEAYDTPLTSGDEDEQEENEDSEEDEDEESDAEDSDDEYDEIEWGPSWPIRHFFAMLKNQYIKLDWIPYNDRTVIDIDKSHWPTEAPDDIPQILQSIYYRNGWPDLHKFDKEACLAELKREVAEKYPNMYGYWLCLRQCGGLVNDRWN